MKYLACLIASLGFATLGGAETLGKVELSPAYAHVDILQAGHTIKDLNMAALRGEADWVIWKGLYFKVYGLYGRESDGELWTLGTGIGFCFPFFEKRLTIAPQIGISYTNLSASFGVDLGPFELDVHERFKGWAPYAGFEACYRICEGFRATVGFQWAWSRSHTKIKELPDLNDKSDSDGPSYSAQLEYDLTKCWSINVGGIYSESFGDEKDGIRASGFKVGVVRWF